MEEPTVLFFAHAGPATDGVRRLLIEDGIRVIQSEDPADAVEHLMDEPVGVLLLDGGALTPFTERLLRLWRGQNPLLEAVGIAATGTAPELSLVRMDCRRIITPPLHGDELVAAVRDALDRRVERARLVQGSEKVASLVLQATQALVSAVELKDAFTRGRADRVALFAGILADEVGGVDPDRVRIAARVMDVGKTSVPGEVLNKTDRLTDAEYEQIKRHPVISWEILRHMFRDELVLDVARHHHERWDGRGYPDGLEAEAIPLAARVVAVADSMDAMTSTRAFRQARLWTEAVDEIVEGSGVRYDPEVVSVFERAQERMLVGA